ncbi:MAG: hypothetical protein A2849_00410 [Candidatus Taylorbacteria bacterium RIFCSPHIGHO2_01_FULL_51_15]|uniref:Adenine DNA glycosylase n=1 Tax=Candidatus Taylorbacteria bacterium RIFCSPHIGHO2_01_FULL_51_15 TaxID=1802304 RepID=A0A1G2MBG7_9BACT|nr:MAG: hypothetical protein A2849_00410 [Candidatus Taylorbacteria bacterium RIFCSPHIGHO2_01_FULL_51_15]
MKLSTSSVKAFQKTITSYYRTHKRNFPWRETKDPYAILVSEIMLQQTQADRVIPFFTAFLEKFPTPYALAKAPVRDVLKAWQGLGYNRRALALKNAAEIIVSKHRGIFPRSIAAIDALPGVGPYTAGAIAAFAFGVASPIIETNIRTVYLHSFFKGKWKVRDAEILEVIQITTPLLPPPRLPSTTKTVTGRGADSAPLLGQVGKRIGSRQQIREWYHALMDYGAMLKKTVGNPNVRARAYLRQSKFKGSKRELRGAILRRATENDVVAFSDFRAQEFAFPIKEIFLQLTAEGFLERKGRVFVLAK